MGEEEEGSRRKKRGHSAEDTSDAPKRNPARQLDPQAFAEVDQMVGAFAQNTFGKVLPAVMAGFFGKARKEEELRDPELQAAFMLFWVYGWKDPNGMRIIDAFGAYGPKLHGEQARVQKALRQARLSLFVVEARAAGNKQLEGRDALTEDPMLMIDHHAYETLTDGDAILSWTMQVGEFARPFGVATQIVKARLPALISALGSLAGQMGLSLSELPERKPAQLFWAVYRGVNL